MKERLEQVKQTPFTGPLPREEFQRFLVYKQVNECRRVRGGLFVVIFVTGVLVVDVMVLGTFVCLFMFFAPF